jgi:hypothetical protein
MRLIPRDRTSVSIYVGVTWGRAARCLDGVKSGAVYRKTAAGVLLSRREWSITEAGTVDSLRGGRQLPLFVTSRVG